ncbi:MAG: PQQ-binding-like beta-propeller repeat protein [Pirellulaceae bacterium]|nr:PQQ-binding-like beta-propeller repeat protein [Pirellulaceae bacterium]
MIRNLLVLLAFGLVVGGSIVRAQPQAENPTTIRLLNRLTETPAEGEDVEEEWQFIPPSRESLRPLISAARLIKTSKFSNASVQLGDILADQNQPDFLIPLSRSQAIGFRQAAHLLMELVPESALSDYRLKYAVHAQQLLDRAVAELNRDLLMMVSKRYFFTEAGIQASIILGHLEFSRGKLGEASVAFRRVVHEAKRLGRSDPESQLMVAIAELLAGNANAADLQVRDLIAKVARNEVNFRELQLLGEPVRFPTNPDDGLNWLTGYLGSSPIKSEPVVRDWQMAFGSPDRNAISTAGLPMLWPEWSVPLHVDSDQQEPFSIQLKKTFKEESKIIPAFFPIAAGNTVMFRSREKLVAFELDSGKLKWSFPPNVAWNPTQSRTSKSPTVELELERRSLTNLSETVFAGWLMGELTSDGQNLYSVPFSQYAADMRGLFGTTFRELAPPILGQAQVLRALELERHGALKWQIGGASGLDDPQLTKTSFLGAPLAVAGKLYAVCKQNDIISVVALNAASGRMEWALPIAVFPSDDDDDYEYYEYDRSPMKGSLTPSFRDGVLICPCGNGAIVAISLDDKSLLWGYSEPSGSSSIDPYNYPNRTTNKSNEIRQIDWIANRVIIDHAVAAFTQPGLRRLILIELATGHALSAERINAFLNQQGGLYLAGIRDGKALCVARKSISAADIFTGELTWAVDFDHEEEPSGHGFYSREHYHLPLSSGRVLKISLRDGKVTNEIRLAEPLGNLISHRGYVISQGPSRLSVLLQNEPLLENVEPSSDDSLQEVRLKLRVKAIALSKQGELDKMIDTLETLWKLDSDDAYSIHLKTAYLKKVERTPDWTSETLKSFQQSDEKFRVAVWLKRIEASAGRDIPAALVFLNEGLSEMSPELLLKPIPFSSLVNDGSQVAGTVRLDRWIGTTIGRALKTEADLQRAMQGLQKTPINRPLIEQLIRAVQNEYQRQLKLVAKPHDQTLADSPNTRLKLSSDRRWHEFDQWGFLKLQPNFEAGSADSNLGDGAIDSSFVYKLVDSEVAVTSTMEIRELPDNRLAVFDQNFTLIKHIALPKTEPSTADEQSIHILGAMEHDEDEDEDDFYDDDDEPQYTMMPPLGFGVRLTKGPWNLLLTERNAHMVYCPDNDWQNARLVWSKNDLVFDLTGLWGEAGYDRFAEDVVPLSFGFPATLTREGDLVWLNGSQLEAIDVETGNVFWQSPGHLRSRLIGLQDEVAVFQINSRSVSRFELATGLPIGQVTEVTGGLLQCSEGHVLKTELLKGEKVLHAVNLKTNADSWNRTLAPNEIVVPIRNDRLGIYSENQTFQVLDSQTGKSLLSLDLDGQFPPRTKIRGIKIKEVEGRLLVFFQSRQPETSIELRNETAFMRVISSSNRNDGLDTGYLVMIDQTNGKLVWPKPLRFEAVNWSPDPNSISPVMAGFRKIDYNNFPRSFNRSFMQVIFIDLRTGREVSRVEDPSEGEFPAQYQVNWADRNIVFSIGTQRYSFEFGSEGPPPAPAANLTLRSTRLFRTPEISTSEESKSTSTGRRKNLERMQEAAAKEQEQRELIQKVFGGDKLPKP